MLLKCLLIISVVIAHCINTEVVAFFDPLFDTLKNKTYCQITECCNERYITADIRGLQEDLNKHLFGQHITKQQLIRAIEAHFKEKKNSKKPLVISFHGTQGTGKNFVADKIAQRIYEKGYKSKYVRKYYGRSDFPLESDAQLYSARILKEAREAIGDCPRSLFIFDEVERMPPKVFESLTSLINFNAIFNGVDSTQAIFIFLSNTAGVNISDKLGKLMKSGTLRERTRLSDFEKILEKGAYNLEGGLKKTSLIELHLIDHFIPFLPLEKSHVHKCAQAEFQLWGKKPKDEIVERLLNDYITYDRVHGMFVTAGCKKMGKKVAVEAVSPDV
ncbi:torsin-like protein [Musca autumnalis]|uniref:torsin-like protein n=1 Tax=Musca autumnalis TaxID=221902 RepID=UPI003CEB83E4